MTADAGVDGSDGAGVVVEPAVPLGQARVLVAGYGVTGRAVASALAGRVAGVTTVDARADDADVRLAADSSPDDEAVTTLVDRADLVVTSPGWPPSSPLFVAAGLAGVPVWSEIELAWRLRTGRVPSSVRTSDGPADTGAGAARTAGRGPADGSELAGPARHDGRGPAPWLVVTGTNGKTTTVEMLDSILRAAGLRSVAVGNVGRPLIEAALDPELDVLAVELSSFQLHFTHSMSARAAAVLNIAPDHLDWHGSLDAYTADKGRIFSRAQVACVDQGRRLDERAGAGGGHRLA